MSSNLLERLISVIAPTDCHICGIEGYMLCLNCRPVVLPDLESRCYLCNKLTVSNSVCASCRSSSRLRRVWWLAEYEGTAKELIHALKYGRKRAFAHEFGEILAESLPYIPEDTLIMPIPTASSRIRVRGFDQAVLLAKAFSSSRVLPLTQGLRRTSQVDQIGKGRVQRLQQMKSSLAIGSESHIVGKNILLVDDVLTTGATLEAAASALRRSGAKHVDAAVIARRLLS